MSGARALTHIRTRPYIRPVTAALGWFVVDPKQHQPAPIRLFLDTTQRWLDAVAVGDLEEALRLAAEIVRVGEMLAADPEYRRLFTGRAESCPEGVLEALRCIGEYYNAVTGAAATASEQQKRRADRSAE